MFHRSSSNHPCVPWNKGKLMGQKLPLSMQEIWSIRIQLQGIGNRRDLALVQPGDRQQTSSLRFALSARLRCREWQRSAVQGHCSAEEDKTSCALRDNRTDTKVGRGMD